MRRLLSIAAFLFTFIAVAFAGLFVWGYQTYTAPGPLQQETVFTVEIGSSVNGITNRLVTEQVIDQPLLFRFVARVSGTHTKLQAGEYLFESSVSMKTIMDKLATGDVYERRVTIPEGLTSWQIIKRLNENEELSGDQIADIPPEGSLLPETYSYSSKDTRTDILERMRTDMTDTVDRLWAERPEDFYLKDKNEFVTLAAIVEKETAVPSERTRVAGVFKNRLDKGIALQTDPTVIYALTGGKIQDEGMGPLGRRLLKKDLAFDSPYNTYLYRGLPPGPIANPGRASLEAVLNPEAHKFIYFVADGTGGHVFAETLAAHNENVMKWRKIRRSQEKKE